jgi:hypothetical protein
VDECGDSEESYSFLEGVSALFVAMIPKKIEKRIIMASLYPEAVRWIARHIIHQIVLRRKKT